MKIIIEYEQYDLDKNMFPWYIIPYNDSDPKPKGLSHGYVINGMNKKIDVYHLDWIITIYDNGKRMIEVFSNHDFEVIAKRLDHYGTST